METHTELDLQLYEAAHKSDLEGVRRALAAGANVNALIDGVHCMLAYLDDVGIVRELLDAGADPNLSSPDFAPDALYWAANSGRTDVVKLLLEAGARIELELNYYRRGGDMDFDFESALHAAVEDGHLDVVRLLLDSGGKCMLDKFNYVHRTPLMVAVDEQNIEMVKLLIAAGSDVNARDEPGIGNTAIHHAVKTSNVEVVKLLLEAGADPRIPGWMGSSAVDAGLRDSKRQIVELLEFAIRAMNDG